MIIVSMGAGLGNQMFEYAFYTHLKHLYPEADIKVDTRYAFPFSHNGIELFDIFNLEINEASREDVFKLTNGYRLRGEGLENDSIIRKVKEWVFKKPRTMRIQTDFTEFYPEFLNVQENEEIYFYGPFVNYKYFENIAEEICSIYQFPVIEDPKNREYKYMIENTDSVSVHIRRGDYVSGRIELLTESFYNEAISIIEGMVSNPHYFVFSDDTEEARKIFRSKKNVTIVEGNSGKDSYRDMQLMSLCKHNITANSTFSFWGAFLNMNIDKKVVASKLAFTGSKCPIVCEDWILV